ncbi:hypothetical protein Tco_0575836, partial [Tanacetum coccineum]
VSKHKNAKDVWESIKVRYIGAERVQKARLQILRNELEMLKMNDTESINDFAGKISGIVAKFKSLGSTLEEEVIQRMDEQDQLMLASDQTYGESSGRGKTLREVEGAEEEEEVVVTKVEFGAMIVESLGTLAMSAQNGTRKITKPT